MEADGKSTQASLLQPREGAGKYWWETFVRTHISDINRRFNQAKALYIPNLETSLAPVDLFSYVREAALCFEIGRYLPAILLASKSVELIMARDARTQAHRELLRAADNTITLCSRNLAIARKLGLPIDLLLSPGEVVDSEASIMFADRATRVNAGSVAVWLSGISEYLAPAERSSGSA